MGVLCLGVCVITAAWRPGGDPSLTGSADVPPLGMSALSATKSQPSGAYIPTKSVGTYAPPLSYHTDSRGEGCLLGLHSGRPAKEVGLNRLRKNLDGVSFRGAAGDEESCIALKTHRARFLASLGMTVTKRCHTDSKGKGRGAVFPEPSPCFTGAVPPRLCPPGDNRG